MLIILRNLFAFSLLFFTFSFGCYAVNGPSVSASSAVLIDADTLEVLYQKDAHKVRSMASTTKIMTALLAVESGKLNENVTVKEKIYIEGTAVGFEKGDKLTLEALCYGMLLESGNDAAVLTANYLAGSEEKFSILMNKKADEIGLSNTNFVTASGLDDENHYTTAYDMALLGAYAVKIEKFREICSAKTYRAEFIDSDKIRTFSNHNRLLKTCDGVFGIKTGFTKKSGRCLVTACERDGKTLVAVTLNAPDDWNDHSKLYDYGYSLYERKSTEFDLPEKISVYGSEISETSIKCLNDKNILIRKDSTLTFKVQLAKYIYAPIKIYDCIGKVTVYSNGYIVDEYPIYATKKANLIKNSTDKKPGFFTRLVEKIYNFFYKERK